MDYSDILQDISVDLSFMVKKHLKNIKKLDSKKQRAFGKLFADMKNGVDDLSAGYVGPKFAKKASDEDILAMADLKDEKAKIYNRYLKDIMSKISKLQKKYNIKE